MSGASVITLHRTQRRPGTPCDCEATYHAGTHCGSTVHRATPAMSTEGEVPVTVVEGPPVTDSMERDMTLPSSIGRWSAARQFTSTLLGRGRHQRAAAGAFAPATPPNATPSDSFELDPRQCALLVLGCQTGILDELADSESMLLKTNAAIDMVRLHGGQVVFTRIAFEELDYRFSPTTNKEFSVLTQHRRFRDGTPEAALNQALQIQADDIVVRTTRLGAFSTTDLDEQLTNLGVTTLILAGAHTTGALLSTTREAADRDYRLIVLSDCCADPNGETHRLLMEHVFPRQSEITTAAALYMSLAASKADNQRYSKSSSASRSM